MDWFVLGSTMRIKVVGDEVGGGGLVGGLEGGVMGGDVG